MSDRDLELKLKIDRSQAAQAISQHDAQLAASKQKAFDHFLAVNKAVKSTGTAMTETGKKGVEAFEGINAKSVAAVLSLQKVLQVTNEIGSALKNAQDRAKGFADEFIKTRDGLRELAKTMGVTLNDDFVKSNQQFNKSAMMTTAEGLAYRNRFYGSGVQFQGKNLSAKEFSDLEKGGAQLATVNGIDAGIAGDMFGGVAGMFDYNKFGDQAGEKALAVGNQSLMVLQRGRGLTSKNVDELTKLNSATFAEQEKLGITANPVTNAAMVSLAAELNPNEAALPIIDLLSEMRKKGGKAEPLMRSAGLKGTEDPIEMLKAIQPMLQKEMDATGLELDQVAGKYFDERASRLLTTFINKGVIGGGFADRIDYAKGFEDPEGVQKEISAFQGSQTGRARQIEAEKTNVNLMRGGQQSSLELLRRDAENRLRANDQIDTASTDVADWLFNKNPLNAAYGSRDQRVDQEIRNRIKERVPQPVIAGALNQDEMFRMEHGNMSWSSGSEAEMLNKIISAANANGIDLLKTSDEITAENNRLLKQNNDLLAKLGAGTTVPAALPSAPRQPPTR